MPEPRFSKSESVRIFAPPLILALGFLGFMVLKQGHDVVQHPPAPKEPPLVDTVAVEAHTGGLTIKTDGGVVPYREVLLSAEVAGRIVDKTDVCEPGKFARKGQLLLKIDPTDYELQKNQLVQEEQQAQSELDELEVDIKNTESLIDLAEQQLELEKKEQRRQLELFRRGATTQSGSDRARQAVLQADNAAQVLKNQLILSNTKRKRLQSALELVRVRLEAAARDLERTVVEAPFDGVVVSESVEVDSYVQKGSPLVTLEDTSAVEVKCQLLMDELYWIWNQGGAPGEQAVPEEYQLPETPVTVVYRLAGREFLWQGTLWRYDGIGLDERTRTVPCCVLVQAPQEVRVRGKNGPVPAETGPPALVRGMFVALEIHARPRAKLLRVPKVVVQPGNRLWRVRAGRLHTVHVRLVEMTDKIAVVSAEGDELRVGDRVVLSPLADVVEGTEVRQRRSDAAAAARESGLATRDRVP